MRQTFGANIPQQEQLARISRIKSGHRHMHTKGPGRAANDAANKKRNKAKYAKQVRASFSSQVRDYWLGIRDTYPCK